MHGLTMIAGLFLLSVANCFGQWKALAVKAETGELSWPLVKVTTLSSTNVPQTSYIGVTNDVPVFFQYAGTLTTNLIVAYSQGLVPDWGTPVSTVLLRSGDTYGRKPLGPGGLVAWYPPFNTWAVEFENIVDGLYYAWTNNNANSPTGQYSGKAITDQPGAGTITLLPYVVGDTVSQPLAKQSDLAGVVGTNDSRYINSVTNYQPVVNITSQLRIRTLDSDLWALGVNTEGFFISDSPKLSSWLFPTPELFAPLKTVLATDGSGAALTDITAMQVGATATNTVETMIAASNAPVYAAFIVTSNAITSATGGCVQVTSLPTAGCTLFDGTNIAIGGATYAYTATNAGAYTINVSNTAPRYHYSIRLLNTNAPSFGNSTLTPDCSNVILDGTWTPTGTNIVLLWPDTGTVWRCFGRGL